MRMGLFWKLFLGLSALSLLTALLVGVLVLPGLVEAEEATIERQLDQTARLLAGVVSEALAVGDGSRIPFREPAPEAAGDARITVITDAGVVIADTHHDVASMDDHASRPEIAAARASGRGRATRRSDTAGTRMLYVARRVEQGGRVLGFVRTAQSVGHIDERKDDLRDRVVGAALVAVLVSLAFALYISSRLTRPLRSLSDASREFADGNYARRVVVSSGDELGGLGEAFNRMADQLGQRVASISRDRSELRAILRGMEEGVLAVDEDLRVVLLNDAAAHILDTDPRSGVGLRLEAAIPVPAVGETLAAALDTDGPVEREVRLTSRSQERVLQLHAAPVGRDEGGRRGAVLVLHDITDLRHLEVLRREFVANVSHELKTPLAAIRGFTETILEDPDMEEGIRRRFLGRVRSQVMRLGEMVEEVLLLSRLESDTLAGRPGHADLAACIREIVQAQAPRAEERDLALHVDLPDGPLRVQGDDESLWRIVGNLLDNAVKYTPEGGRVEVRARRADDAVICEVEDNGIGIPKDLRERVFERFYRVDPGRSREAGGTGLGLSIVKHLVAALEGEVEVDAADGGGSVFRVRLRRAPESGA